MSKPYKIWSSDRKNKKSVTASTLEELKARAKDKIGIPSNEEVKIVFETDGTEVDEDDYFQFLPFNTTLMVLRQGEVWKDSSETVGTDEVDFMMPDGTEVSDRVKQLAAGLRKEITRLITFSNEDLQFEALVTRDLHAKYEYCSYDSPEVVTNVKVVQHTNRQGKNSMSLEMAEMSSSNLAQLLGDTETYAKVVQEACQRHLDERQQTTEALELLKLYHKAREHSLYVEGDDPKRQKFSQT